MSPGVAPTIGAASGTHRTRTGVHCLVVDTATMMRTPMDVPMKPPTRPMAADSARNWAAMCLRVVPTALLRPISPSRSSTDTRVTIAISVAPTRRTTAPRTMKRALTSDSTCSSTALGSGGTVTRSIDGSFGDSAMAACCPMSWAAPISVRIWTSAGAWRFNRWRAVLLGMMIASRRACSSTSSSFRNEPSSAQENSLWSVSCDEAVDYGWLVLLARGTQLATRPPSEDHDCGVGCLAAHERPTGLGSDRPVAFARLLMLSSLGGG